MSAFLLLQLCRKSSAVSKRDGNEQFYPSRRSKHGQDESRRTMVQKPERLGLRSNGALVGFSSLLSWTCVRSRVVLRLHSEAEVWSE
jgi:hypothetical protein